MPIRLLAKPAKPILASAMRREYLEDLHARPFAQGERITRALLDGAERDFVLAYRVGGMRAALGALNARTHFRITALCRLEPNEPTVYDRENPRVLTDQPVEELWSAARAVFQQREDPHDPTARGCGTRELGGMVTSHAGAVVISETGTPWGVLFHHDHRLRLASQTERSILSHLAGRLALLCPAAVQT